MNIDEFTLSPNLSIAEVIILYNILDLLNIIIGYPRSIKPGQQSCSFVRLFIFNACCQP